MLISVIIPLLNEEETLPSFLETVNLWDCVDEVLFVDGGSNDATLELLRSHSVITGATGRGLQCRLGVEHARGDAFVFVHADSHVCPESMRAIRDALEAGITWGCLTMHFDSGAPSLRFGAWASNMRVRFSGIPFGDQVMFMTRAAYDAAGGMPDIPIMEDYELARRLRSSSWPKQLPQCVTTSARRFEQHGVFRTMVQMHHLRHLYRSGVNVDTLSQMYRSGANNNESGDRCSEETRFCGHASKADAEHLGGTARILFTRTPFPGLVKTRLASVLSPEQRAEFQEALIIDTALKLLAIDDAAYLCCTDERSRIPDGQRRFDEFYERVNAACPAKTSIKPSFQHGEQLGESMANAFSDAFANGADACLLIGSDLPYITTADIIAAERLLDDADVVFGPSDDGGYWLVGLKQPFLELFSDERYGTSDVLERALSLCALHGKTVALAPSSPDIDTPDDFEILAERVRAGDARIGSHTLRFFSESFPS